MKKILAILLITSLNSISAQQVFPINTPKINIPNGAYYKDLEGELNPYIGIWKGTWEGKTLYLQLKKIKDRSTANDGSYYDSDQIVGERKIISSNGAIEVDRITNFDQSAPEFYGIFGQYKNFAQKYLLFQPKDMCNKTANVNISFTDAQKTQMNLSFQYNPLGINESCQYYNQIMIEGKDWPFNFPKNITLTKQ
ncbi:MULTISPECIES: DUF6705 family protein [Chryseobacterium]|uniref:DUF6705 domain-containing protein n=1 Tax=Chryseobacterium indologenes TaxID=253 RepID=A0A0N0IUF6_CHRID|nr:MULTISPECIES: DUF6705 family protein [Chryseobacterium]KPE49552.1 hypothetical protein AOB46_19610 [Chryseobacterium indologenes]MDR6922244.1 hypothetical protein [Chryseobacterium sp. 2987]